MATQSTTPQHNTTIPEEAQNLINTITFLLTQNLLDEALRLETEFRAKYPAFTSKVAGITTENWLRKFITQDPEMESLKQDVRILATVSDSVLIRGPSGTGKELIAHALHGSRMGKFVAVNCTSLPDYLMESELFGHIQGSFTGATRDKIGLFQYAHNGTLFLDEIGDMAVEMQAKLLRVLQERKGRKVGANDEYDITTRVVCATNQNLEGKRFREDLYERISVFELWTRGIVERLGDIPAIVKSLDPQGKFPREKFDWTLRKEALAKGNVRAIQKIVRRYLVLGKTT